MIHDWYRASYLGDELNSCRKSYLSYSQKYLSSKKYFAFNKVICFLQADQDRAERQRQYLAGLAEEAEYESSEATSLATTSTMEGEHLVSRENVYKFRENITDDYAGDGVPPGQRRHHAPGPGLPLPGPGHAHTNRHAHTRPGKGDS